jgi:hypothetical protein
MQSKNFFYDDFFYIKKYAYIIYFWETWLYAHKKTYVFILFLNKTFYLLEFSDEKDFNTKSISYKISLLSQY